jgi:hypothetical protein
LLLNLLANQPPDFFHDSFGQFVINVAVAIVVGLITAFVAIWVFRKQRSKKEISYQVISNAPIASVSKGLENRVTIHVDGKPVGSARQVVLKIRNSGNVAVSRDDYDMPINFAFEESLVIEGDILSTEPEDLINTIDKKTFINVFVVDPNKGFVPDSAVIDKILLNPKESITLTFLLSGAYDKLNVRGRIVNGEIVMLKEIKQETLRAAINFTILWTALVSFTGILLSAINIKLPPLQNDVVIVLFILVPLITYLSYLRWVKR